MVNTAYEKPGIFNEWVPGVTPPENNYSIMGGHIPPMQIGFPQSEPKIFEWVPGVSTPEGLILAGTVIAAATNVAIYHSDTFERLINVVSNILVVTTTTAIPAAGVFIGAQLIGQG